MPAAGERAVMEILLLDLWREHFRARWLAGESGVDPKNN